MKMLTIVGARPQFIKAATVSRRLRSQEFLDIEERIVHTGQHYDHSLSAAFFEDLGIPEPFCNLGAGSGSHGAQTGAIMKALEKVINKERPDWILLYGDTNSTLAGAIVAAKAAVPIAHVEAGLRSFRRGMPEEVNRIVTDTLSDLLFAPTTIAADQLRKEGKSQGVYMVGDVMYDNFLYYRNRRSPSKTLNQFDLESGRYILATVHREENTDDKERLRSIIHGLERVSRRLPVVFPAHPRTIKAIRKNGLSSPPSIKILDPLPYTKMLDLLVETAVVATDSGGLQKEAYFASVPCVTLRNETEWVETLEKGWNRLAPPDQSGAGGIEEAISAGLDFPRYSEKTSHYGSGDAAGRILEVFLNRL